MLKPRTAPLISPLLGLVAALSMVACEPTSSLAPESTAATTSAHSSAVVDAALNTTVTAGTRTLLETAFAAGSALPTDPHSKTRSRLQAECVAASVALGLADLAEAQAAQIDDWRRGVALADIAVLRVQQGRADAAEALLVAAGKLAATPTLFTQDWQRERVLAAVARVRLLQGHAEESAKLTAGLEPDGRASTLATRAATAQDAALQTLLADIGASLASTQFDSIRHALEALTQLFGSPRTSAALKAQVEAYVRTACAKMPMRVRVETLTTLATAACASGDKATGLRLLQEAHTLFAPARLLPQDSLPLLAVLASARHKVGDAAAAQAEIDAALKMYWDERARITDIERADALRSLAEAMAAMGRSEQALQTWRMALEEGVINPNGRPRAEDLVATCCSMAVHGAAPDAALLALIARFQKGLVAPW